MFGTRHATKPKISDTHLAAPRRDGLQRQARPRWLHTQVSATGHRRHDRGCREACRHRPVDTDEGGWEVHGWKEYQLSGEEHEARRRKLSERGRAAAAARWQKGVNSDT